VALSPGQRVSTPHPKYVGRAEGVYVRDAPDDVVGPAVDGRTQRIPQGTVKYPDGRTKTWPRDAIEPIDS